MSFTDTCVLIRRAASHIFLAEGRLQATTDEIASQAGIAPELLTGYYSSSASLFREVFRDVTDCLGREMDVVMQATLSFRERVSQLIEVLQGHNRRYPYHLLFLVTTFRSVAAAGGRPSISGKALYFRQLSAEVLAAMESGVIVSGAPLQFILDLFSLVTQPYVMEGLFHSLAAVTEADYEQLLAERKEYILSLLFR